MRDAGLAYVPEERMRDGVIGDFAVSENLMLPDHADPRFCRRGFLRFGAIHRHCQELVRNFAVSTPTLQTAVRHLSGGNIQKLILARELSGSPRVLLAAQPTRGVDVGAAEYIHRRLLDRRREGTAIIVMSEDLDEVLLLSDRIAVLYEGRVMGVVPREEATPSLLGLMMAGVRPTSEAAAPASSSP